MSRNSKFPAESLSNEPTKLDELKPGRITAQFPPDLSELPADEVVVAEDAPSAALGALPATGTLFTLSDIQAIIAGVMAAQGSGNAGIGAEIAKAIREGMAANAPRRKVTIGEYDPKTSFHPNKATAVHFKANRQYFQNGGWIDWNTTSDRECELLNAITHSGRYIDRIVEVVVTALGSDERVDIRYHNRSLDQRFTNATKWRNFEDMLEQIVKVQRAEDAEEESLREERDARRRLHTGASA